MQPRALAASDESAREPQGNGTLRTIRINLSTLEVQDRRTACGVALLGAALIVCLTLYNLRLYGNYRSEVGEYERRIAQFSEVKATANRAVPARPALSKKESDSIQSQAGTVNRWIAMDIYPWDRLLDELERCTPPQVVLLRFASAKEGDRIRVEGKAASMNDVTGFLQSLDRSGLYRDSILLSVSTVKEAEKITPGTAELPIRFEIDTTAAVVPPFRDQTEEAQSER